MGSKQIWQDRACQVCGCESGLPLLKLDGSPHTPAFDRKVPTCRWFKGHGQAASFMRIVIKGQGGNAGKRNR
jgi:hypothetical protein